MGFDKGALMEQVVQYLSDELARLRAIADTTRRGAIHEEAKPENDKDTRALEQSYLARGQAERVALAEAALQLLRFWEPNAGPGERVALGSVVELTVDEEPRWVFMAPAGGGLRVSSGKHSVQLVTPEAPLGRALIGKQAGECFELTLAGVKREYEVLELY